MLYQQPMFRKRVIQLSSFHLHLCIPQVKPKKKKKISTMSAAAAAPESVLPYPPIKKDAQFVVLSDWVCPDLLFPAFSFSRWRCKVVLMIDTVGWNDHGQGQ